MGRDTNKIREIAFERVGTLFSEAGMNIKNHPERSSRYVGIAFRVAAKAGIRIPSKYRSNYCRKCKIYLSSGINSRVRTNNGKLIIRCNKCGGYRRIMLRPKKTK